MINYLKKNNTFFNDVFSPSSLIASNIHLFLNLYYNCNFIVTISHFKIDVGKISLKDVF